MRASIGIVLGGAESVWAELELAQELCRENGVKPKYLCCNDMIEHFSKDCVVTTLHADKLPTWLANRAIKGMSPPEAVWVCTKEYKAKRGGTIFATNFMDDLGGSVGLFACRVAITYYGLRVILCGVPLTEEGRHFVRGTPWKDVSTFERRWHPHIQGLLKGKVRSYSGKTKEWFGAPDVAYVTTTVEQGGY